MSTHTAMRKLDFAPETLEGLKQIAVAAEGNEAVLGATDCSACGQTPRRRVDYGDFSEYEARCLVAQYVESVTVGTTGWGVSFRDWVELRGIAKPGKLFQLFRLPNSPVRPQDR